MQRRTGERPERALGVAPTLGLVATEVARSGDLADRRLAWVIAGLVVLAVVITIATFLFWWATRPVRVESPVGMRWVDASPPTGARTVGPDGAAEGAAGGAADLRPAAGTFVPRGHRPNRAVHE
jgi:hypothetical protein